MSEYREYSEHDLLRLAKRVNNAKRSYLLVDPLQGKHIPANPEKALMMMRSLGKTIKERRKGRPLVIGFSETATAIGAAVAAEIGEGCFYIQTTRETDENVQHWIYFSEEHSHASEQKLCGDGLDQRISQSDYILLVDDEISTGKTILNIVSAIRKACPAAEHKPFVVASVLNRIAEERLPGFVEQNISFVYLLHLDAEDFEARVKNVSVQEAAFSPQHRPEEDESTVERLSSPIPDARRGVTAERYLEASRGAAEEILRKVTAGKKEKVLVLGTEEFMFPALLLARELQKTGTAEGVKFHATTRSPIGICCEPGYPITNGVKFHSFYDKDRATYLYDLESYDMVIVFTDAKVPAPEALNDLKRSLEEKRCRKVLFFCGNDHV